MAAKTLVTHVDGTIVEINGKLFALAAWEADQQLCDDEIVYAGYTIAEWQAATDASAIVVQHADGRMAWTAAGNYNHRFHDAGGLRVVGYWYGGDTPGDHCFAGDAYELWATD